MAGDDITILFVDDEASILHSLERYLIRAPWRLLFAQNGSRALEIMADHPAHIVVTDMKMPEMDGLELLKKIKEKYPDTVRLVLSGYSRLSAIIPAINSGEIYRYVTKPIQPGLFKQTLKDAIDFYLLNQDRKVLVERLKHQNQELSRALNEKKAAQKKLDHTQSRIEKNLLNGRPPENMKNADIAIFSRSATTIGGDFYDIIRTLPNGFDIVIGDVMGKGVPAALMGAGTKQNFLKALGQRYNELPDMLPSPAMLTQQVQKWTAPGLLTLESFVTSLYARVDQTDETLVFSDCGHTPVVQYLASEKKCCIHKGINMPIGIREDEIISQTTVKIHPGDLLLFLSDGIIETCSPENELFGLDRLSRFIQSHHYMALEKILDQLEEKLDLFRGTLERQDDMTCIIIKIKE